jgi:hypothetical protein
MKQQHAEQRALPRAAEGDRALALTNLEGAEDAEFHGEWLSDRNRPVTGWLDSGPSQPFHRRSVMSQLTHSLNFRAHTRLVVAALLALAATAAVVLVLAIGGDSIESVAAPSTPAQASGPNESNTAAAISGQASSAPAAGPDESRVAASISGR